MRQPHRHYLEQVGPAVRCRSSGRMWERRPPHITCGCHRAGTSTYAQLPPSRLSFEGRGKRPPATLGPPPAESQVLHTTCWGSRLFTPPAESPSPPSQSCPAADTDCSQGNSVTNPARVHARPVGLRAPPRALACTHAHMPAHAHMRARSLARTHACPRHAHLPPHTCRHASPELQPRRAAV